MKVRIKFAKYGTMRFIGHLDLMRFFQKVIRRAGIDIAFSEGMSPHMILSFAAPLGVGAEGMGEYADIRIQTPITTDEALKRLNANTVEGIRFLDFREVEEGKAGKAMSLVAAADYLLCFRPGHTPTEDWQEKLEAFLARPSIPYRKETKKGSRDLDLKPLIYAWEVREEEIFLRLATGSSENLKPEQVIDAFLLANGWPSDPLAVCVRRLELYARSAGGSEADPDTEKRPLREADLISLQDLGTVL